MDPAAPSGVGGLIRAIEAARTLQVLPPYGQAGHVVGR